MSSTGKKTTAIISCTTLETVRVADPIVFYEADRAHIIYMSNPEREDSKFYDGLLDTISHMVKEKRDVEIIPHNATVYRYNAMLKEVNDIIAKERETYGSYVEIYVNISSGTPEYAAAAMCACMMNPGTIPFTVRVKEHVIPFDKYVKMASVDGRFVGDAKEVYEPRMIETFNIKPPDEELVKYLAFFSLIEGESHTPASIIKLLETTDTWKYVSDKKEHTKNAVTVAYNRNVRDPLVNKGWLVNGSSKNRWLITPAGRAILDIFYDEDDPRSFETICNDLSHNRAMLSLGVEEMNLPTLDEMLSEDLPENYDKVYFDMDGVLADFDKGVQELCAMKPNPLQEDDPKYQKKMFEAIARVDHFFAKLEPIPGMPELFDDVLEVYGKNLEILTSIPDPKYGIKHAEEDKKKWVKKYLGKGIKVNVVSSRKEKLEFVKGRGYVLIDDYQKTVVEWNKAGGTGILFKDPVSTELEMYDLEIF